MYNRQVGEESGEESGLRLTFKIGICKRGREGGEGAEVGSLTAPCGTPKKAEVDYKNWKT